MYLESFLLPIDREELLLYERGTHNGGPFPYVDNPYPCGLFSAKELYEIRFGKITIFYGGNGSGKSTLLNLIAQKLQLNRIAPFNSGEMFSLYADNCEYKTGYDDEGFPYRIPNGSRVITSDDIFDYMLTVRTNNNDISENKENAREEWANLKFGETIKIKNEIDFEAMRLQIQARRKSQTRRQFIRRTAGQEVTLKSNGETALDYFRQKLRTETLYCLDEPENSMSPKMQLEFVKLIQELSHYCDCQFIIATHSPFLLALEGARVYDLDSCPVEIKDWWRLENPKLYYDFFKKYHQLFDAE